MGSSQLAQPDGVKARPRILVVDDDTCMFDVFGLMLPSSQFSLAVASHGKLAVELAQSHPFDVAFVDYFLGEMKGPDVAHQMRKLQPGMKIVLMSGYLVEERAEAMERAGASAFLTKPFSIDEGKAVTEQLVEAKDGVGAG